MICILGKVILYQDEDNVCTAHLIDSRGMPKGEPLGTNDARGLEVFGFKPKLPFRKEYFCTVCEQWFDGVGDVAEAFEIVRQHLGKVNV